MIGGKNIIVFLIACAFAYYQFSKAKGRAAIHSPQHQLKVSKNMMQHQLNMYEYEVVDATNTRGERYVIIMERIKESMEKDEETAVVVQTPKILGVLIEDRVASRMYRNNAKRGKRRHQYRQSRYQSKKQTHGRNRGQYRRRHGVHPNRRSNNKQAIHYEPRLKLLKYSNRLNKVEFLLVQRGLITNKIGKNKETKSEDQIKSSQAKNSNTGIKQEKISEEEIKEKSIKEIEKRELDKVGEEGKKKSEQEKKSKEENRKEKKKAEKKEKNMNEDKIVDATIDANGESNVNVDGA